MLYGEVYADTIDRMFFKPLLTKILKKLTYLLFFKRNVPKMI